MEMAPARLGGSPAAGTDGTYSLVFKAHNGVSPAATQNFTLTVNVPPAITSANNTVFTASMRGYIYRDRDRFSHSVANHDRIPAERSIVCR